MINFPCSTFTWKTHPFKPDAYYKYSGGFVGKHGQVYHVRFNLEAKCEIRDDASNRITELFLGSSCRSEYTIAKRNLFQVPNGEWRMAFSREHVVTLAKRPSWEAESSSKKKLSEVWQAHRIDIRKFPDVTELNDAQKVIEAALANEVLNVRSTYRAEGRGLSVTVEFPVNLINFNTDDSEFQVCTGPILLPDLNSWDGTGITRVFVAQVALSSFDWVEFVLQREIEAAAHEKEWHDRPRGLDRLELRDPKVQPPGYPPPRQSPTVYHEVWEFQAHNVFLRSANPSVY